MPKGDPTGYKNGKKKAKKAKRSSSMKAREPKRSSNMKARGARRSSKIKADVKGATTPRTRTPGSTKHKDVKD